jgi:hypothetical protein
MHLTDRGRDALNSLKDDLHSMWCIFLIVLIFAALAGVVYVPIHFIVKYW